MNNKCVYITKTQNKCKIKYKKEYCIDNNYYCKKHFNQLNKKHQTTYSDELKKYICSYITKNNKLCKIKANVEYQINKKYYCKKHFDQEVSKKKNNEKEEILDEIENIKKYNITIKNKSKIKKDIYKLLLKIHPDKCILTNINSHELTQELTDILNKIKLI